MNELQYMPENAGNREEIRLSDFLAMEVLDKKYVGKFADELIKNNWPTVANLKNPKLNELKIIIQTECCLKKITPKLFCDGALKISNYSPVMYHSHYGPMVWDLIAVKNELPKVILVEMRYILANVERTEKLQGLYWRIRDLHCNGVSDIEVYNQEIDLWLEENKLKNTFYARSLDRKMLSNRKRCKFMTVTGDDIEGWKGEKDKQVLILGGIYDVVGGVGTIIGHHDARMPFRFEIDIENTRLTTGEGDRKQSAPYSKNPRGFIYTKFRRMAYDAFYQKFSGGRFHHYTVDPDETKDFYDDLDIIEGSYQEGKDDQIVSDGILLIKNRIDSVKKSKVSV